MTTYKDLKAQWDKLGAEVEAAREREQGEAIQRILQDIEDYGIQPEQLGFMHAPTKRKGRKLGPAEPKYRDPKTGATWSGRGRAPAWLAGKNREKFLIE